MIQAYFSQIKSVITKCIESSTKEICIAVAWFTHRDLYSAIIKALSRNVKVSVIIIDDLINRGPYGLDFDDYISRGGVIRFISTRNLLMHNKFCLFDGKTLVTGSYNWTYSAETRNAENIIVTDEETVCNSFYNHFYDLWNGLLAVNQYNHLNYNNIDSVSFLNSYDYLQEEYISMFNANVIYEDALINLANQRKNYSVNLLNTIITNDKRANPVLKSNIGMRCQINGIDNQTLIIIKQGEQLPCAKKVFTFTVDDFQEQVICNVVFGNNNEADKNESLVSILMDDLPKLKAGEVKFSTTVTIDTNGYMHVEYVCVNTGISKSAIYDAKHLIEYK